MKRGKQTVGGRVDKSEIENALRRVEKGKATTQDASLLRAVFVGFESIADCADINIEFDLAHGTDKRGKPCHWLLMTYPDGKE